MIRKRLGFLVLASVVAAAAFPAAVQGQRSGVEIWAATCGNCHRMQPGDRYTPKDWDAIGMHMAITARLTDAQATAVIEFLKTSAMKPEGSANGNAVSTASRPEAQRSGEAERTLVQVAAAMRYIGKLKVRR